MTALPHTPQEVAGVADHRGDVIPVIALRRRFGLVDQEATRATKWILVRADGQDVGLVVDKVTEVFGTRVAPEDAPAANYAFDVTPAELVTAIITDVGVLSPPYIEAIQKALREPKTSKGE